jgi:predicted transcriptional regulator
MPVKESAAELTGVDENQHLKLYLGLPASHQVMLHQTALMDGSPWGGAIITAAIENGADISERQGYRALNRLTDVGVLREVNPEGAANQYEVTQKGIETLEVMREKVQEVIDVVDGNASSKGRDSSFW